MSPEVLIYVQTLKQYFINNNIAREYFNITDKEDIFFDYILEFAQKNFEENGEPQLTVSQMEDVRHIVLEIKGSDDINKNNDEEIMGIFITIGDMGYISLN